MRGKETAFIAIGLAAVVVCLTVGAGLLMYRNPGAAGYPTVYRDIVFDHAVYSDYAYYYFEDRVNKSDTFSQAAHRWIRLWDYMRNVTVEENIEVEGVTYARLRVLLSPIKVMQTLMWCEVQMNYTRVRGHISSLMLSVNLTGAYEGALNGWWDNDISAYLKRTSLYGDGARIPAYLSQDGDTSRGRLRAFSIWIFNDSLNAVNYSQSVQVMGPWDFYEARYVNYSVALSGRIVDGSRAIDFAIQFNVSRRDVPWALSPPEVEVPSVIKRDEAIRLNITPTEGVDEYFFFWGDGTWSTDPVHMWNDAGNYIICVFYRKGANLSEIRTLEVSVV